MKLSGESRRGDSGLRFSIGLNVTVEIVEDCGVLFMLLFNFGPFGLIQVAAQAGLSGVP